MHIIERLIQLFTFHQESTVWSNISLERLFALNVMSPFGSVAQQTGDENGTSSRATLDYSQAAKKESSNTSIP